VSLTQLTGKGFFVFSDPGGAKPVLTLAESLKDSLQEFRIVSDRQYNFFNDFLVPVNNAPSNAAAELVVFKPDFLFTGTSYTSSVELEYIKAAKELSIYSFAFVDHWTNIRERFQRNGKEYLPDKILVIDEKAKQLAIGNGIDEDKLIVFGNPYHNFLKNWKPVLTKAELFQKLGLDDLQKKIVLYAPDPLSNVDGINTFGFDEIMATKILVKTIKELGDKFYFLLNPHPNQNVEMLESLGGNEMRILPAGTDVNMIIYYADVVIGFFSSLLIEAGIINRPVIRFFINDRVKDPLAGMNVGEIAYPETLVQKLKAIL